LSIIKYELFFDVDWQNSHYTCREKLFLDRPEELTLDAVGMKIRGVEVDGSARPFSYDGKLLKLGNVSSRAEIEFERDVPEELMGFYRAPYDGGYIMTTHFEPDGARLMFPCQDEPSKKARFKLNVKVDPDLDVISNMPPARVEEGEGKKSVEFQETPPMSTYLLYLGIGKFDQLEDSLGDTKLYVAAFSGKSKRGRFALEVAKKALKAYSEYFGIPYQLPKLHLIAVPEFAMGAMENWGAITFRETALLADEKSGETARRGVATTIVHELAHQWFGDLVTMKWWDDLWLNESFATYLSYKVVDGIFPEWQVMSEFLSSETSGSLLVDSLSSTHPIHVEVRNETEAEQIFDAISYGKGASVLRMIESYMGEEEFKKGLSDFLKRFSYSNATASDLWDALEKASGKPVSKIMSAWVNKAGHPVIAIAGSGSSVALSQRGFRFLGNWTDSWPVPLVYVSDGDLYSTLLEKDSVIRVGKSFKLNADGAGYYRVLYQDWGRALSACRNAYDQWNVISDMYAHLLQGVVGIDQYLGAISGFSGTEDALLSQEISSQLGMLYAVVPDAVREASASWHRSQVDLWQGKENAGYMVGRLARRLVLVDREYGVSLSSKDYWSVPPDLRQASALAKAVWSSKPFQELRELYSKADEEDRTRLLHGMMAIRRPDDFRRALDFLLTKDVRKQDLRQVVAAANNVHNRKVAWDWFKANFPLLRKVFSSSGVLPGLISSLIPYVGIGSESDVSKFFEENDIPEAIMGIRVALELLQVYSRLNRALETGPSP